MRQATSLYVGADAPHHLNPRDVWSGTDRARIGAEAGFVELGIDARPVGPDGARLVRTASMVLAPEAADRLVDRLLDALDVARKQRRVRGGGR